MWLKQKVFTFDISREGVAQDDRLDNIKVSLNGNLTTISIEQLFAKISSFDFSEDGKSLQIKGWSLLQDLNIYEESTLKVKDNDISISFEAEELGSLKISSIKNPWFILNDMEIEDSELEPIYEKLLELSDVSTEDNNTGAEGSPHTSPPVFVNSSYESGKAGFIKRGFAEYENGNFKLLVKNSDDFFQANLIELLSEDKLSQLQNGVKIIDGFYKFEDSKNQRTINAKIIDGQLDISFSDVPVDEPEYSEEQIIQKNPEFKEDDED